MGSKGTFSFLPEQPSTSWLFEIHKHCIPISSLHSASTSSLTAKTFLGNQCHDSMGWIKYLSLPTDGAEVECFIVTAFPFEARPHQQKAAWHSATFWVPGKGSSWMAQDSLSCSVCYLCSLQNSSNLIIPTPALRTEHLP